MELTNQIILIAGLLFLVSILASVVSYRLGMPVLLMFLGLGMLAGEDGPGGIHFSDVQSAHLFGSMALAIILFDGGLRTKVSVFRVALWPAAALATAGVILTAAITGVFAAWIFDLNWLEGLLVGAIVGSTDAAAVFALLRAHDLGIKQRVGATLEIESGSNDPMAIFLTIALIEVLLMDQGILSWTLAQEFIMQMGLGAAFGLVGGRLLVRLINRLPLTGGLYPLLALSGALGVYGCAAVIGGSGFLAIYLAGLVLGNRRLQAANNIERFHDGMAWLSQIGMFLMLGLLVTPSALLPIAWQALLVAAVLILIARPLAVLISLAPFRFPWREQVFISWVGLRGAVPIVLALFPLLAELDHATLYFNVAFFVVLVSLLVQGWSVAPVARWLRLEVPATSEVVQRVELDVPGQSDFELVGYKVAADSPALARPADDLPLPDGVQLATILRGQRALRTDQAVAMQAGDRAYLIAKPEDLPLLDRVFVTSRAPERLSERRFFGEFVLDADAKVGDLAAAYNFEAPPHAARLTLAEYLSAAFSGRAVVGDAVALADVQLVVREMDGAKISKVGLKLMPAGRRQRDPGREKS
ncbi:MAG: potassium/proton antiporter [Gammaproteobacteria bacterium]